MASCTSTFFASFSGVDVGGHAVAVLREGLRHFVAIVAFAEAEHGQIDAFLALSCDEALQLVLVGDADVEVAIGGQEDAIDAAFAEALLGERVRKLDAFGAGS